MNMDERAKAEHWLTENIDSQRPYAVSSDLVSSVRP